MSVEIGSPDGDGGAPPSASPSTATSAPPASSTWATTTVKAARARGLTVWAIIALLMSPFSIPTGGVSAVIALGLIAVALVMRFRGFNATRPLVAGIVAAVVNAASASACGYLFLRPAEVTGHEAKRQDRVEDRFDQAFDQAGEATPSADVPPQNENNAPKGGAEVEGDADSSPTRQEP